MSVQSASVPKLAAGILSAAVGATYAGTAQAGYISTAPAGFTPATVTIGVPSPGIGVDVDRDGTNDVVILPSLTDITLQHGSDTGSAVASGYTAAFSDPGAFDPVTSIKAGLPTTLAATDVNGTVQSDFTSGSPTYVEIGYDLASSPPPSKATLSGKRGYLYGTLDITGTGGTPLMPGDQSASFTLLDFGVEVPEPASLALLATGLAGIAAMRRRRAATAA